MSKFLKYAIILAGIASVIGGYFFFSKNGVQAPVLQEEAIVEEAAPEEIAAEEGETEEIVIEEKDGKDKYLPEKFSIEVPFTVQAPFAEWDAYHQEACEEASLIMLKYYFDGKSLTPQIAEREIQSMIAYQIEEYGDYRDSDAAGMVRLYSEFYGPLPGGKKLKVVYDFSKDDLKEYLSRGEPIIVPAAGRLLGNPYFTQPGPLYHALVLKGYEGNTIITNDPGTKRGEGYAYDISTLYAAIHDFPGNVDEIEKGRKAMIVVE